jgi:oligopeptide transport system substrate-binding protein
LKKLYIILISLILVMSSVLSSCNIIWPNSSSITTTNNGNGEFALNLYSTDPTTLDPAVAGDSTSSEYILQIYSGLLQLDEQLKPAADIAERWDTSTDGLTYTFYLRKNVTFQDGRSLTALDFKYSWERAADPSTKSLTAATYLGDIVGISDILSGKSKSASGIKIIDDYTLQVTIDSPKSYFLFKLTYPTAFAVDKDNVSEGSEWWRKPNGTGPFTLNEWTENQSLTLDRNNLYYGEPAKLRQIKYQFLTGIPMDLYETGKIDITGVSTSYIDAISDKSGPFYTDLITSPALSFYYIGFNCAVPPFDDVNIRKAFSLAIDKDKIVSLIYRDMVMKGDGILPPGIPGYNQNLAGLEFNVAKANEFIKASKYGDISKLPPITLTTSGYGGGVSSTLQALVYQWKQNLGVDVKIRQLEPEKYFYNLKEEKNQMFDSGWSADYPHPQDFLDILFSSGTNNNYGEYSNVDFDALINKANQETDLETSFSLYQQAEQLLVNDAACLPLTFDKNYLLIKPYVKGYSISPLGFADLKRVSILPQ